MPIIYLSYRKKYYFIDFFKYDLESLLYEGPWYIEGHIQPSYNTG